MITLRPPFPPNSMSPLHSDTQPRQYAVPAEPFPPKYPSKKPGGLSYVEHEMLRQRKTPHGILLEEDYPVVDKHVQYPASKHVLLSSSPGANQGQSAYDLYPPQFQHNNTYASQFSSGPKGFAHGSNQPVYPPSWDFPGGLDSVLNQALPLHPSQRYYIQQGSTIPTVLPAALHTNWGPTASANQEHYGPYWPDGTFNPYRPAAVRQHRDNRYYDNRLEEPRYPNHGPQYQQTPQLRKPGRLPFPLHDSTRFSGHSAHEPYSNEAPTEWQVPQPSNRDYPPSYYGQSQYQSTSADFGPISHQLPMYQNDSSTTTLQPLAPNIESDTIAFRDKCFTWATRIYAELLVNIQRSTRDSNNASQFSGIGKVTAKPAIYPKPPKRSGSHFSDSFVSASRRSLAGRPTNQSHGHPQPDSDPARPPTAIYSPHRRASDFGQFARQKTFTTAASPFPPPFPLKQDFRRTSDSTVYQASTYQNGPSVQDNAYSALTQMELLCEEAVIPWIDGMLLAGCLAYGLGTYDKALHWYQTILMEDTTHVEAMSNLAATLLALNRRDEAMEYWTAAVRLRP